MNNKIFTYQYLENIHYIILKLNFAIENGTSLRLWLAENTPTANFTSVVIEFTTKEDVALFLLRWS